LDSRALLCTQSPVRFHAFSDSISAHILLLRPVSHQYLTWSYEEYTSSREDLTSTFAATEKVFWLEDAGLATTWNRSRPVARLSPEIITMILDFVFEDELAGRPTWSSLRILQHPILRTSNSFRQAAIHHSRLWTVIATSSTPVVLLFLRRSRSLFIDIYRYPVQAEQALALQSSRWRTLVGDGYLLGKPAPHLKTASVRARLNVAPADIFGGLSSELRILDINFLPRQSDPIWHHLQHLELEHATIDRNRFIHVLGSGGTSLKHLSLTECRFSNLDAIPSYTTAQSVQLAKNVQDLDSFKICYNGVEELLLVSLLIGALVETTKRPKFFVSLTFRFSITLDAAFNFSPNFSYLFSICKTLRCSTKDPFWSFDAGFEGEGRLIASQHFGPSLPFIEYRPLFTLYYHRISNTELSQVTLLEVGPEMELEDLTRLIHAAPLLKTLHVYHSSEAYRLLQLMVDSPEVEFLSVSLATGGAISPTSLINFIHRSCLNSDSLFREGELLIRATGSRDWVKLPEVEDSISGLTIAALSCKRLLKRHI